MRKIFLSLLLGVILLLASCTTKDNINYMKDVDNEIATQISSQSSMTTIQPGDQLAIRITAKDMSVVRPFIPNSQLPDSSTSPYYLVDRNGDINFPILGLINTTNKSITMLQTDLVARLSKYIINPSVAVSVVNYKVTILGEVNRPGQYNVPEGQNSTILNVLGLAGDVTIYAKKNNILLVRTVDGKVYKERINLLDGDFINSPAFMIKQNDVIYVSANETKEKIARQDPNTGVYMAVAGMIIGLAGIFITIFRK